MVETEQPVQPFTLDKFLDAALTHLTQAELTPDGHWSLADIWAQAETYEQLAGVLDEIRSQFVALSLHEGKALLFNAFSRAQQALPTQLQHTAARQPALFSLPKRRTYVGAIRASYRQERDRRLAAYTKIFIPRLVDHFIAQTRQAVSDEDKARLARLIEERVASLTPLQAASPIEHYGKAIQKTIRESPLGAWVATPAGAIEAAVRREQPALAVVSRVALALHHAAVAALNEPVENPGLFFSIVSEKAGTTGRTTTAITEESRFLTRAAAAAAADTTSLGDIASSGIFFRSIASGPVAPLVAPLADALLNMASVVFSHTREAIIQAVVERPLIRALENIEVTTGRLGERLGASVAQSPFVTQTIARWSQTVNGGATASVHPAARVRNVIADVVSMFFGTDEAVISYLELVGRRVVPVLESPAWQTLYAVSAYPTHPRLFHLEFAGDLGRWILSWGKEKAAKKTIRAIAGVTVEEGTKAGTAAILTRFGFSGLAALLTGGTSLMVRAAVAAGGWLLGGIWRGAKYVFSAEWIARLLTNSATPQKPEPGFWLALGVVGLLLLFILPFPGNPLSVFELATKTPLAIGGGPFEGAAIDCSAAPDDPLCDFTSCRGDCRWPTTGTITQGPGASCRSPSGARLTSHDRLNAVDIGASYLEPVYSITDGTVDSIGRGCADNSLSGRSLTSGCNGGWGNYVDVRAPSGAVIRYAHLSTQFIDRVSRGQTVNRGSIIGKVDNNGNSTNHHLHIGIMAGPGNILDLLPVTKEQGGQLLGCVNDARCTKLCPALSAEP